MNRSIRNLTLQYWIPGPGIYRLSVSRWWCPAVCSDNLDGFGVLTPIDSPKCANCLFKGRVNRKVLPYVLFHHSEEPLYPAPPGYVAGCAFKWSVRPSRANGLADGDEYPNILSFHPSYIGFPAHFWFQPSSHGCMGCSVVASPFSVSSLRAPHRVYHEPRNCQK